VDFCLNSSLDKIFREFRLYFNAIAAATANDSDNLKLYIFLKGYISSTFPALIKVSSLKKNWSKKHFFENTQILIKENIAKLVSKTVKKNLA